VIRLRVKREKINLNLRSENTRHDCINDMSVTSAIFGFIPKVEVAGPQFCCTK